MMPSPTNTRSVTVRERERQVWQLRCRGLSQERIAQAVNVGQPAVSRILRRAERRVLAEIHAQAEGLIAEHVGKLRTIYAEAMREWSATGSAKLLEQARCALGDERKLLGLDAPMAVSVSRGAPDLSDLSDDEVETASRVFRKLRGLPDDGIPADDAADEIPMPPGVAEVETREIADPDGGPPMVVVFPGKLPN